MGLADVDLDLFYVKIDPAEVLPRRVRNLLGPRTSAASTPAEGGASLDSSLMMFMMFYTTLLLAFHCVPTNVLTKVTGSLPLVATKKKHGMRNLSNEYLGTDEQRLVLLAAALHLGLVPDRDPDSRS